MKEIECSGKSVVSIIHIGCIFIFLILFTGMLLYNRSIDIILGGVMILSCIYLIYLILNFINEHIWVNENGIEYTNFLNLQKKYVWDEIVVEKERNRGAAIVFSISRKKIRVYSYYRNYHLLNDWLNESGKYQLILTRYGKG